jgi:hypothetical protein
VRLFDKKNQFIGYSEFEVQSSNSIVTMIVGEQSESFGVVRTVYGTDADYDSKIDTRSNRYDYFTQISTAPSWPQTQVEFLSSSQGINLTDFTIADLPRPTPTSFLRGQFSLIDQVSDVFSPTLASAITALPGQVVATIDVSTISITTYEVTPLLTEYESVGVSREVVVESVDRRSGDRGKAKKLKHHKFGKSQGKSAKHCNQGRGNGSEGCDPGNSRPHGGSNDE